MGFYPAQGVLGAKAARDGGNTLGEGLDIGTVDNQYLTLKTHDQDRIQIQTGEGDIVVYMSMNIQDHFRFNIQTPSQITGDEANLTTVDSTFFRISSDAARNIRGIGNQANGRLIIFANVGSFNITFKHEDAGGTNKINSASGADVIAAPNDMVGLIWDSVSERWRILFHWT